MINDLTVDLLYSESFFLNKTKAKVSSVPLKMNFKETDKKFIVKY